MSTFTFDGIEYFIGVNPKNKLPMLMRVDGLNIDNRKVICRRFLRKNGWKDSDFVDLTTNELEREIKKMIGGEASSSELKKVTQELGEEDKKLIDRLKSEKHIHAFNADMVNQVLSNLAKKNHFFVSEAHLQTEFIIEAARLYPEFDYYPELVPSRVPQSYLDVYGETGIFFDLVIRGKGETIIIEFKYLTKDYEEDVNGFHYAVKHQSAQDIRRHDCWHDISRIEMFVKDNIDYGYFILITNDASYWRYSSSDSADKMFKMFEGLHKKEIKKWNKEVSNTVYKGRDIPIPITNDYYFEYKDFYQSDKKNGAFKSLVVEIYK